MIKQLCFIFVVLFSTFGFAGSIPGLPDEYKNLHWYRFNTKNFEILSIDEKQGVWLAECVEQTKTWVQKRWGLADISYDKKCMIVCVPQQQLYEKWFREKQVNARVAKTKSVDGSDRQVYAIWLAAENGFLKTELPEQVGLVNLLNYESMFKVRLPRWMHVGMSALNNDVRTIRNMLGGLDPNKSYDAKAIFEDDNKVAGDEYRAESAAACLLLRKQHDGAKQFIRFIESQSTGTAEQALTVYGWHGYSDFKPQFTSYVQSLSYDIRANRTPDMGLTWFLPGPIK